MESDKYMYTYIDKVNRIVFDVSRQAKLDMIYTYISIDCV